MKKKFVIVGISLLVITSITSIAFANQKEPKQNPRPDWIKPGKPETVSTPNSGQYLYPDNSFKNERQLIKKNYVIKGKLKENLNLKGLRLIRYSQYIDILKADNGDVVQDMQIHPNRLVWVAFIEAPEGIEINQKNTGTVKYKKSKITIVFDAETGERFATSVAEMS
ncbi:hypothetical protein [Calothrix sp. CCY 0018]|uniref:hypothetical protein n=1 Tax=Calothrix sp. CCY 0018 TaxID=3103864 RepID=UPI0039C63072